MTVVEFADTKPQFFDETGSPLVDGRMTIYKLGTATMASLFSDRLLTLPLSNPVYLASGAWPGSKIYSDAAMTVVVQKRLVDGSYADLKPFDILEPQVPTISVDGVVNLPNVPALRAYSAMADNTVVTVNGYNTPSDSYVREYQWSATSVAVDNGGTIVSSTTTPTGRWLLRFGGSRLDIRAFGVIPGASDVNSQFRAACNWAAANNVTLVVPAGVYTFASGGSFDCQASLDVARGARINCGGTYSLTISKRSTFVDGFAGTGVSLLLTGTDWSTADLVPIAAFGNPDNAVKGALISLLVTADTVADWTTATDIRMGDLRITGGASINVVNSGAGKVVFDDLLGAGQLRGSGVSVARCATSQLHGATSEALSKLVRRYLVVDDSLTITAAWSNAYNPAITTTTGSIVGSYTMTALGALSGRANSISCQLNVGSNEIPVALLDVSVIAATWQASTTATMDLLGKAIPSGAAAITRSGTISNGSIACGLSVGSFKLRNVIHTGSLSVTTLDAADCSFTSSPSALSSSTLTRCSFSGSGTISGSAGVWTEVGAPSATVRVYGGGSRFVNVSCASALLIPDSSLYFRNFSWLGGSVGSFSFDASQGPSDGSYIAYNVAIKNIIGLASGIASVNGALRKWAVNGHYNVDISDNEKGWGTRGRGIGTLRTIAGTDKYFGWVIDIQHAGMFKFNSDNTFQLHYATARKIEPTLAALTRRSTYNMIPYYTGVATSNSVYFHFTTSAMSYTDGSSYNIWEEPGTVGDAYMIEWDFYPRG